MVEQYDRTYVLSVGEADPLGLSGGFEAASSSAGALRLQFEVVKTELPWPNSGKVVIWNLNSDHRDYCASEQYLPCRLEAGYGGSRGTIIEGYVRQGVSVREGTDWLTTLELADGEVDKDGQILASKSIRKAWTRGTPVAKIITDFAQELNVDVGNAPVIAAAASLKSGPALLHGLAVDGPILDELTYLMRGLGLRWSIQDGALQLRIPDVPAGVLMDIISPFTGLVGHVTKSTRVVRRQNVLTKAEETKSVGVVEGTTLLLPGLSPGQQFVLQSEAAIGAYLCSQVKHHGDSRGPDWYTDFEGLA